MKTTLFASAIAVCAASLAFDAAANSPRNNAEQVEDVTVEHAGGIVLNHVTLKPNGAKYADSVVVAPTSSSFALTMQGKVKCAKHTDFQTAKIYFGPVERVGNEINESTALHSAGFGPEITIWGGLIQGWITEAGPPQDYVVPLAAVKNGHPLVRFDPLEEFNKKMQEHIDGGQTKASFLREDRHISVSRPISMAGMCREDSHPYVGGWGYATTYVTITIKYEGDPEITGGAGQMANANNQLAVPFQVLSAKVDPHPKHTVLDGPGELKFTVSVQAQGKGQVKYRLVNKSGAKGPLNAMNFVNGGTGTLDFTVPACQPKPSPQMQIQANPQQNNPLNNLVAQPGGKNDGSWAVEVIEPHGKTYAATTYTWTCVAVGQGGTGGITMQQPGGDGQGLNLKVQPVNPDPSPTPQLKVQTPSSTPELKVQSPTTQPQLRIQPRTGETRD